MSDLETVIAKAQWWSGWCTDEGHDELGGLLLDVVDLLKRGRHGRPKV